MHSRNKNGFTLVELLVVIAIISLLIGILVPALSSALRSARGVKDAAQIAQVHASFLVYSETNPYGSLATPGLINRWTDPRLNVSAPGTGEENEAKNSSGHLYSAMIAQEYFNCDLLISPVEFNPAVEEFQGCNGKGYDYTSYSPAADTYWQGDVADPTGCAAKSGPKVTPNRAFQVRVDRTSKCCPNLRSNTSYAHLMLCGDRRTINWRNSMDSEKPVFATRGPGIGKANGVTGGHTNPQGDQLTWAMFLHGPKREWHGQVCYSDNHVDYTTSVYPDRVGYQNARTRTLNKDHIFSAEHGKCGTGGAGWLEGDTWLGLCETMSKEQIQDAGCRGGSCPKTQRYGWRPTETISDSAAQ